MLYFSTKNESEQGKLCSDFAVKSLDTPVEILIYNNDYLVAEVAKTVTDVAKTSVLILTTAEYGVTEIPHDKTLVRIL